MRGPRGEDRYRITVRLTEKEYKTLQALKADLGVRTISDAVRYSINFTHRWQGLIKDIYKHIAIETTAEKDTRMMGVLEQYRARLRRRRGP